MPYDFRAPTSGKFKATMDYYLDNGTHTHRGSRVFPTLEKAKKWIVKNLDPKLNCDWCICDDIGIELEGH